MKEFDSKNVKKIEIILCKINAEKIEKNHPVLNLP